MTGAVPQEAVDGTPPVLSSWLPFFTSHGYTACEPGLVAGGDGTIGRGEVRSACSTGTIYCTTSVRFVVCFKLVEPEAKVPVTVRLYVLAGVPPLPPPLPPPPVPPLLPSPPQPVVTTTITARKINPQSPTDFHGFNLRFQAPKSIRPGKPHSER
jgi:hypothetical protein